MGSRVIECTFNATMDSVRVTLPCSTEDDEVDRLMPAIAETMAESYAGIRAKLRAIDPRLDLEVFK